MQTLEDFIRPTQKQLFQALRTRFRKCGVMFCAGNFILVRGTAPVMLVAHMDTVHKNPVEQICASPDGNILMSPQGIGGDDRCGCYALVKIWDLSPKKPWLLFTCNEELGGLGADMFCKLYGAQRLPKGLDTLKFIVELDRKGSNDAVYYNCANADFEDYVSCCGFVTATGSFSDISFIAPDLGVAAVNLSCGYYNAHTLHEYINVAELEHTIVRVLGMVDDATQDDFPVCEYVEFDTHFDFQDNGLEHAAFVRYGLSGKHFCDEIDDHDYDAPLRHLK